MGSVGGFYFNFRLVQGGLIEVTGEQKHECSEGVGHADSSSEKSKCRSPEVEACLAHVVAVGGVQGK